MNDVSTILIVDDEQIARDVLEGHLHREGYMLVFATKGHEAFEYLEQVPPDLVLLDVMMPDIDGFEVCRRIKNDPRWRHIPVIMVTALGSKEDLVRGFDAGADDFLNKPVDAVELRARVRSMLRIKRQYDELQEALRLREDMAKMIVHDMRTPLTSIIGFSELMQMLDDLPEAACDYLERITEQAYRLEAFLNDMLLLAKMEAGQPLLHPSVVDPVQIIIAAIKAQKIVAESRRISLETDLPPGGRMVTLDANLFRRVVENLLSNAIKFSPPEGRVTVRLRYTDGGPYQLCLQVLDEGPGVPPDKREEIFDKYRIVDFQRRGVLQVGLGLAFCKMVVDAHQGRIYVEDNQPSGSIFTVEL
ncbi:MAG: sensor histidine kinase [Chloroflexi bacterium]|nr:MAG: sensor histidine kinase [Chloroflexota bacterium]